MKRVLFITYYWPPSGGPGVQRGVKFVKYLPDFGVRPIVLTVDPAHASYPSIDRSLEADVAPGLRVVRTRSFEPLRLLAAVMGKEAVPHAGFAGAPKPGPVQRLMRWVRGNWMIPDARRGWVKHAVRAAAPLIAAEGIEAIVISSPPHSSQLIGLELKRRFPHLRWIADLRDPWMDIYYTKELMKGRAAQRRDARWEARVFATADHVLVTSPSTKALFATRYGKAAGHRITVIPNGYDAADVHALAAAPAEGGAFRITYVGTMAASYAPQAFFAAVRRVSGQGAATIALRFVGGISAEVKAAAKAAGVGELCTWVPPVPHDEALREMAAADMLLLATPQVDGEERIIPGKVFEYLAVRRPILALGPPDGDVAALLTDCEAGRAFARNDVDAMAAWISACMDRRGPLPENGRIGRYERRVLTQQLAHLIGSAQ